jgi:hypothetical protein
MRLPGSGWDCPGWGGHKKTTTGILRVAQNDRVGRLRVAQNDSLGRLRVAQNDRVGRLRVVGNDSLGRLRVVGNDSLGRLRVAQNDSVERLRRGSGPHWCYWAMGWARVGWNCGSSDDRACRFYR